MTEKLSASINGVRNALAELTGYVRILTERSIATEAKLDAIESKVDAVTERTVAVESKVDAVTERTVALETKVDAIPERVHTIDKKLDRLLWSKGMDPYLYQV